MRTVKPTAKPIVQVLSLYRITLLQVMRRKKCFPYYLLDFSPLPTFLVNWWKLYSGLPNVPSGNFCYRKIGKYECKLKPVVYQKSYLHKKNNFKTSSV